MQIHIKQCLLMRVSLFNFWLQTKWAWYVICVISQNQLCSLYSHKYVFNEKKIMFKFEYLVCLSSWIWFSCRPARDSFVAGGTARLRRKDIRKFLKWKKSYKGIFNIRGTVSKFTWYDYKMILWKATKLFFKFRNPQLQLTANIG